MSNEITAVYPDGFNLYAFVRRRTDGYIWNPTAGAFEAVGTWNDARAGACDIPLTGYDGGLYMGDFAGVLSADTIVLICLRAGANPATTDAILGNGTGALEQVWRRFFKKATATSSALKTYKDDASVATTQTVSFDGTTKTVGNAS